MAACPASTVADAARWWLDAGRMEQARAAVDRGEQRWPDHPAWAELAARLARGGDPATAGEPSYLLSPGSSHEDHVTGIPEHHALLRTERDVRLAWVGQHVDHARQCHEVGSEVGPHVECSTEHDQSRALLTVASIGDDLRPTEPLTLVLASTGVRFLAGDARGGAVVLAIMRQAEADRAELDYVVLSAED